MENIGGINTIVLVLVVSFAIDRLVNTVLFALPFFKAWDRRFPDPRTLDNLADRTRAENALKFAYVAFAIVLAVPILAYFGNIRILQGLNVPANPSLDILVTGLILVGGSDFVGRLLQLSGAYGGETSASQPIEITGRLVLEQSTGEQAGKREQTDGEHV